jgi:hypothetical protein
MTRSSCARRRAAHGLPKRRQFQNDEERVEVRRESGRERSRQYYQKNAEHGRERARQYRERNPEKAQAATRRYREQNPEKHRETARRWREQNRDDRLLYSHEWHEGNCEYERRQGRRRRQRLAQTIPAPRSGEPWIPADDVIVMRDDIYLVEICYLLGRSYCAVKSRRRILIKRRSDHAE